MRPVISRLMALIAIVLIVGAAFALKAAGFEYAELDALFAAGLAGVLTVTIAS